jgi:FlgD Ig-like domain
LARFLPVVLVVGLLGGSAAAFAVTERLKLERSPIFATQVGKVVSPATGRRAKIWFRLRKADSLSLAIVDSHDRVVRALISSHHVPAGQRRYAWNGTNDSGSFAPDGTYKPRVHLAAEHRTILLPNPIVVDTKLPHISLTKTSLAVVSPDGDTRHDYLKVFFKASEPVRAVLYANGRQVVKLKSFQARSLQWGRRNGMPTKPRVYRLRLRAIDEAGNLGPPSRVFTVRIRYIELGKHVIQAKSGGKISVRVSTDARSYFWRIGPRHGQVRNRRLVLAAGAPGRYHLVVSERGHKARALVVVSP